MATTMRIQHLANKHILHIKTAGTYTAEDSKRMVTEIAAMKLPPEQVGILIDHRETEINLTLSEIYGFPENYYNIVGAPLFSIAILFKKIGLAERFYKAICTATGYMGIQIFTDYDEAEAWLNLRYRATHG